MRNQDTNYFGRNGRMATLPRFSTTPFDTPQTVTGLPRATPESDLDPLGRTRKMLADLEQEERVQDMIEELTRQRQQIPTVKSLNDRLVDDGVREWSESDKAQKLPYKESRWPETMDELFPPATKSVTPDSGINPLVETGDKGYNGSGFTNLVSTSQNMTPTLYANHNGYIPPAEKDFRLENGTTSDNVKTLQKRLNDLGYTDENGRPLVVDGEFGQHTLAAVNKFKDAVLPGGNTGINRGVVGPTTWDAIFTKVNIKHSQLPPTVSPPPATSGYGAGSGTGSTNGSNPSGSTVYKPDDKYASEYYTSKYDCADLTPGDIGTSNPYGINVDALLHWAYSQVGYTEKSSNENLELKNADNDGGNNYTKYGKWLNKNGDAWCAAFASWCASMAGIPINKIANIPSTNDFINWYMNNDRFQQKGSGYIPKAGDLFFTQTVKKEPGLWDLNTETGQYYYVGKGGHYNLTGHTGIVVGYDGTHIYTIEGNAGPGSTQVVINDKRRLSDSNLRGFGVNGGSSLGINPFAV